MNDMNDIKMYYMYYILLIISIIIIFSLIFVLLALYVSKYFIKVPWIRNSSLNEPLTKEWLPKAWGDKTTNPKHDLNIDYDNVTFYSGQYKLHGWYINSKHNHKKNSIGIICAHGAGRDKRAFLRHLEMFVKYDDISLLLFDCSSHGHSEGEHIGGAVTYGKNEAHDVIAACKYMRDVQKFEKIVLIGTSTGATAAILAASVHPNLINVIIAENAYGDPISVWDHVVWKLLPNVIASKIPRIMMIFIIRPIWFIFGKLLLLISKRRLKNIHDGHEFHDGEIICANQVITRVKCPILFMHAENDVLVSYKETLHLHRLAKADKDLWICSGSGHTALYNDHPEEFEKRVMNFIYKHI